MVWRVSMGGIRLDVIVTGSSLRRGRRGVFSSARGGMSSLADS